MFLFSAYREKVEIKAPGVKMVTIMMANVALMLLHKLKRDIIDASVLLIEAGILGSVFFASLTKVFFMLVMKLCPSLNRWRILLLNCVALEKVTKKTGNRAIGAATFSGQLLSIRIILYIFQATWTELSQAN